MLFRHLRAVHGLPGGKPRANCALQVAYVSNVGLTEILQQAVGRVWSRCGDSLIEGAGAWGDIACVYVDGDWERVNERLPKDVRVVDCHRLIGPTGPCTWRLEVVVPAALLREASHDELGELRRTAKKLVNGYGVRKVSCKIAGRLLSFALQGTPTMAARVVAVVMARHLGWTNQDDFWTDQEIVEMPEPPAFATMLASVKFQSFQASNCDFRQRVRDAAEQRVDELLAYFESVREFFTRPPPPRRAAPPKVDEGLFHETLNALRRLDPWPATTPGRASRIVNGGDSFSVGSTPAAQHDPRHSMQCVFDLEKELIARQFPWRTPSTMCAINRRARFGPHVDVGSAGAGQTTSLFVSLGEFDGGELAVEGTLYDCKYRPLEFDGWRQRHWTKPFTGERFSLVWFTPAPAKQPNHKRVADDPVISKLTTGQLTRKPSPQTTTRLLDGFVLLKQFLSPLEQQAIVDQVDAAHLTFQRPLYENGRGPKCVMGCLGRAWRPTTSTYDDGAPPIPSTLTQLARGIATACAVVDPTLALHTDPDVCLVNFYGGDGKMGLHQDTSEADMSHPVVSVSLGTDALFVYAAGRDEPRSKVKLESGDVLAFGGASRLLYHGIERIVKKPGATTVPRAPGSSPGPALPPPAPPAHHGLAMLPGRLNLTFRVSR